MVILWIKLLVVCWGGTIAGSDHVDFKVGSVCWDLGLFWDDWCFVACGISGGFVGDPHKLDSSQPLDVRHSPARPSCMVLPTGCCFAKVHPDGVAVSPASGQKFTSPSSLPSRMLSSLISLKISFPLLYPTAPCKALAALPMKSSGLALYDPLASAEQNYSLSFVSCTYLLSGAVLHGCLPTFHPTDHQALLYAMNFSPGLMIITNTCSLKLSLCCLPRLAILFSVVKLLVLS